MNTLLKVSMSLAVMLSGVLAIGANTTLFDGNVGNITNTKKVKDPVDAKNVVAKSGNFVHLVRHSLGQDLSAYKGISFRYYTTSKESMLLFVGSENKDTKGIDYYSKKIDLTPGKWETVVIPFDQLVKSRNPLGFNKVTRIYFYLKGWGMTYNTKAEYYFDDIVLLKELPKAAK